MLRPFDVIMTWQKGNLISWIISLFTKKGPSHICTWIKGLYGDYDFFEVTFPKPRFGYISEIDPKYYRIEIGRHENLPYPVPEAISKLAVNEMIRLREHTFYDIGELFENLLDELGVDSIDDSNPEHFVCSSGNEHIMNMVGFCWCPDQQLVSPQDIRESPFYEKVKNEEIWS